MAILDASLSEINFTTETAYASTNGSGAGFFAWNTASTHVITAEFADPSLVTSIRLDFRNGGILGAVDAMITGLAVPLSSLYNSSFPAYGEVGFWEAVLGGDDTILAPLNRGGRMTGDFTDIIADPSDFFGISRIGGNDTFEAHNPTWTQGVNFQQPFIHALVGDAFRVKGAETTLNGFPLAIPADLTGGDDVFNLTDFAYFNVSGDAQWVEALGGVTGGDDILNLSLQDRAVDPRFITYSGDVEINQGSVIGGNDTINGSDSTIAEYLVGDVFENRIGGILTGGRDTINNRGGNDESSGDVGVMMGGYLTGGNDTLRGGVDSNQLAGDVINVTGGASLAIVTINGGRDTLLGGGGNDVLSGDVLYAFDADLASTINGGNDILYGGGGDDQLFGDIVSTFNAHLDSGGNDTFDGGLGNDFLIGQLGSDTASFASIAAAVTVDLAAFTATGQGDDVLDSIENITGSSRGDRLSGASDANRIAGGAGNDRIDGRAGDDTLIGNAGRDVLTGGLGRDAMNGGGDADRFVFADTAESGISAATRDIISGWDASDLIDVSAIDARPAVGDHAFNVVTSAAPGTGQMRIVTQADRVILQFNTDFDADIEMTIEIRTTLAVTAADFIL